MRVRFKLVVTGLALLVMSFITGEKGTAGSVPGWRPAGLAAEGPRPRAGDVATGAVRLRWLAEPGAESLVTTSPPAVAVRTPMVISVPGAAYAFAFGSDGSLEKRSRLATDPAAPYGLAVTDRGVALADKQGTVSLWTFGADGGLYFGWRRDAGDRATSVGWNGGDLVLVATWKGRVLALAAADGHRLWSADVGGRAEAPGQVDGGDVFIATKAKTLLRLDAATGVVRWRVTLPGPALHPPVLFGQRPRLVLCGTWDGQLLAHDRLTGRVRWSATLPAKLAGAPFTAPEFVAAVTADGAVHSYDWTGSLRWTAPGSAEGPGTLLPGVSIGGASSLLSVSKVLVALDLSTGARLAHYPNGALENLRRRFADAMLEGVKTYSESEKHALLEKEAFEITGPLSGPARVFGPFVALGTEDGWAYVFRGATLRPLARYRAGQPSSGPARLAAGQVVAIAGEEVFALAPVTGKTVWRRAVGADPGLVSGDVTLGVVAGGRVHALDAANGVLQWSLRGRFRSVAPPGRAASGEESAATPWLVDDGEGSLRALAPPGRLVGDPLPAGGDLLPVLASSARSWVVATREGKMMGVGWESSPANGAGGPAAAGRLLKVWEKTLDARILGVHLARGRFLVRYEAGSLAGLDASSLEEGWRVELSKDDRIQVVAEGGAFLVLGATDVRVHDCVSGELKVKRQVPSPAVGGDFQGGNSLRWLDRWGGVHQVDIFLPERPAETTDLGVPLAGAVPVPGGFLVTTAADEVGFVEVIDGQPTGGRSGGVGSQSRGEGP